MYQCEHCGQSIQKQNVCPNCGTTVYSAIGKIICGPTAKDMSCCSIAVTDKYIIVSRMSKSEANAKKTGAAAFGLLGYLIADATTSKERNSGYYALGNIAKGIFPYLATGIKKKNAIKLINKDGSDFILIVDQPGFVDSVWKALKKTVDAIRSQIPLVEDGHGKNFGDVVCAKPFVTIENFDKIKSVTINASAAPSTDTADKPQAKAEHANNPVIITPPPASNASPSTEKCANCGAAISADSKFCNQCGQKIQTAQEKINHCLRCSAALDAEDKFCTNCGYPVNKA